MQQEFRYQPEVFNHQGYQAAKEIVLTPEGDLGSEQRWETETPWLHSILEAALGKNKFISLDFGCGVGRMAKGLVEAGHAVVGVDFSAEMRAHAQNANPKGFCAMEPEVLDRVVANGLAFDLALSVWVLQHCPNLDIEIDRIFQALRPGGVLFAVDMKHRAIPTDKGWVHDGRNVFEQLSSKFELIQQLPYDFDGAPEQLRQNAWLGFFRKPAA